MKLSIVSPVYMAEKIIPELVQRISNEMTSFQGGFELILVDDRGPDNSWTVIKDQCEKHSFVKGLKLSRNFGQHYAVSAGVEKASGENIIIMDCDLQDGPEDIHRLLAEREQGYDIVFTERIKRKHGLIKSLTAGLYNRLFKIMSDSDYNVDAGSLVLFSSKAAEEFKKLEDKDRLYLQMLKWIGFSSVTIPVEHHERFEGNSSYDLLKLMKIALQGWTSHSDKLLRMSVYLGLSLALISFIAGLAIIIKYFLYDLQPGWPSMIVTILFSTGLILLSIGILGIYIGKIFEQSKGRPLYIIESELNFHESRD